MSKDNKRKSKCPKNYVFSRDEVADMADCSGSYVDKIRNNQVSLDTPLAKRILAIDKIASETKRHLKNEIESIVKK